MAQFASFVVTGIHGLIHFAKQYYERGYTVAEGQVLRPYKRRLVALDARVLHTSGDDAQLVSDLLETRRFLLEPGVLNVTKLDSFNRRMYDNRSPLRETRCHLRC